MSIKSGLAVKTAWDLKSSNSSPSSFLSMMNPVFHLFRCFGLDFHPESTSKNYILAPLIRTAHYFWILFSLGTCLYKLGIHFPSLFFSNTVEKSSETNTGFLHIAIEFLNYWIYVLAVFIGAWWIAGRASSGRQLWIEIEELLAQVPLSIQDVSRCRKTTYLCVSGVLIVVLINVSGAITASAVKYSDNKLGLDQVLLELLRIVYFYSFASSALFVSSGRIVSLSFETISRQLEAECCPTLTVPGAVWKFQRRFGIACRAAEQLSNTFGFVLFTTVSYTFIGFVNASYNLLKLYQRLPQAAETGSMQSMIPETIRMTYNMSEHLFRLWMICHTADLIRSKALSLVPVLQSIRNDLYSRPNHVCKDEGEEVHAFLLEVSETSPSYEVLGLFTLTKQVIVSLIGTTLTYLVVLCQFSAAEVKPPVTTAAATTMPAPTSSPAVNNVTTN